MHAAFKKSKLTVAEIAAIVGVSRIAVHNWYAGRTKPHRLITARVNAAQRLLTHHMDKATLPLPNALDKEARAEAVGVLKKQIRAFLA